MAALMTFVIGVLGSCGMRSATGVTPESFPVTRPLVADTTYFTEYVAEIQSVRHIETRAKVGGYLEAIHVDEGQYVRKGQLLFSISRQQYVQELKRAQASLASAIAESKAHAVDVNNTRILVGKEIVSQSELDLAEARLEAMEAKVEQARAEEAAASLNLTYAQIRAPFDGVINRIPNKSGSLIDEGALLTTLSDNESMFAYFNLSEREYLDYAAAGHQQLNPHTVTLVLANGRDYPHPGVIETSESEVDKTTGNIAFRARFRNPNGILKHGSSGKVRVKTELHAALMIPQKSTLEIQDALFVLRLQPDSTVVMHRVTPVVRLSKLYVLSSGLNPGDAFLFEGLQQVKPGDKIAPRVIIEWENPGIN